jgi:hypothetical protein
MFRHSALHDREPDLAIPLWMLPALDVDLCAFLGSVQCCLSEHIRLPERMLVVQIPRLEENDDKCPELGLFVDFVG